MRPPVPAAILVIAAFMALLMIVLAVVASLLLTERAINTVAPRASAARIVHFAGSLPLFTAGASDDGSIAPGCDLRYQISVRSSDATLEQINDYYAAHFRSLGWEPLARRLRYQVDQATQVALVDAVPPRLGTLEIPSSVRTSGEPDSILYAVIVSTWDHARCPWLAQSG